MPIVKANRSWQSLPKKRVGGRRPHPSPMIRKWIAATSLNRYVATLRVSGRCSPAYGRRGSSPPSDTTPTRWPSRGVLHYRVVLIDVRQRPGVRPLGRLFPAISSKSLLTCSTVSSVEFGGGGNEQVRNRWISMLAASGQNRLDLDRTVLDLGSQVCHGPSMQVAGRKRGCGDRWAIELSSPPRAGSRC